MSIYKLKNITGSDITVVFLNNTIFAPAETRDLIVDLGCSFKDIIGNVGGDLFEPLINLIRGGTFVLNDGDRDFYYEEALYLLKFGTLNSFHNTSIAKTVVSHDLCKKTTWYQNSLLIENEELMMVDSFYKSKYTNIISLSSGLMYQEDSITENRDVSITVNDITVNKANYSVDYEAGKITFIDGFIIAPTTDIVKMSYWYAKSSSWEVQTDDAYLWRILKTEVQLDSMIVITSPIIMEVIIDHPVAGVNYVASRWVYKSVRDFISGSNLGFAVPTFGGTKDDAGYDGSIIILPFDYTAPQELPAGMNARVRLRVDGDVAPKGEFGTVTFYMDKIKL